MTCNEEATLTTLIPQGMDRAVATDSTRDDDVDALWRELGAADWSTSAAAYATAVMARRIIESTGMTQAAFAAECKLRNVFGFKSQGSVSRRLRWAALHDDLWERGILPRSVFIPESAVRPLLDGRLSRVEQLRFLAEWFGDYLSHDDRRRLAESLTEAMMRERMANRYGNGPTYRAPRRLIPGRVIGRLLAQGLTADEVCEMAHGIESSTAGQA